MQLGKRQQPRVEYAAQVRLHASDRDPQDTRVVNLGPSGVLLDAREPLDVGAEVLCDITLAGNERRLKGRVARIAAMPDDRVGMGIRFEDLGPADRWLLSDLVRAGDTSRVVQVRFEGMREPLSSRAVLTDDGVRLSSALPPFLRMDSSVEVTFLAGGSRIESRGIVRDVRLDPTPAGAIPRLTVDVSLESPGPVAVRATASARRPAKERRRRARPSDGVSGVVATWFAGMGTPGTPDPNYVTAPMHPRDARWLRGAAAAFVAAAVVVLGVSALRRTTPRQPVARELPAPAPDHRPGPTTPPVPPPTQSAPPKPEPAAAPATPPRAALVVPRPFPPDTTPGPDVASDGEMGTAHVPVTGSTAAMTHYSLGHPRGLAVNLPFARSALPPGLYAIGRDGFRFIWIREHERGGLQIRYIFTHPAPDEQLLELDGDQVKVRVRLADVRG